MSRRRRQGLSPSLFPFLAVLVCTLGTLILLLALVAQNATTAAEQSARDQQSVEPRQASLEETPRMTREAVDALLRDEEFRVKELVAVRDQQTADLETRRDQLTHLDDHMARLRQQLQQLNEEVGLATGELESDPISDIVLAELETKIDAEQKAIEELRKQSANQTPRVVIVPHKGPNGTSRRPVYLECNAAGITIWPEGSQISLEQLENSAYSANPLDAALRTIRMHVMQNYGDSVPPYPLLVVRPDGIDSYGAARRAMQDWDDQFGYELVPAEVKLAFSKPDANLKRRLDLTINAAVAEQRVRMAMVSRAQGAGGGSFNGISGGGTRRSRGSLPTLSAAELDRAGRANGFGPLRDRYSAGSSDSMSGGPYSQGPSIGSVPSTGYAGELTDAGAAARRMAEQMQSAAQEMRAGDEGGATGLDRQSESAADGMGTTIAKHYGDVRPLASSGDASFAGEGDAAASRTGASSGSQDARGSDPEAPWRELAEPSAQHPGVDRGVASSADRGAADLDPGAAEWLPSAAEGVRQNDHALAHGDASEQGSISRQQDPSAGSGNGVTGSRTSQSPMEMPPGMAANNDSPMQSASAMQGSPIMMNDPVLSDPRLASDPTMSATMQPRATRSTRNSNELVQRQGRQWALPDSMAGIRGNAIIRTIRLQCYPDRFVLLPAKNVGATEVFGIFNGDVERATLELATALRDRIEQWGPALPGGRWQPRLEVHVMPHGDMRFHQLRTMMNESGIELVEKESP